MVLLRTLEVISPTSLGVTLENEGLDEPGVTKLGLITTSSIETLLSLRKLTRDERTLIDTLSFYSMDHDPSIEISGQRMGTIPVSWQMSANLVKLIQLSRIYIDEGVCSLILKTHLYLANLKPSP